jgi:hypothetical protein
MPIGQTQATEDESDPVNATSNALVPVLLLAGKGDGPGEMHPRTK